MRYATMLMCVALFTSAAAAEPRAYELDAVHTSVVFKISHVGYSDTFGRFNQNSGAFTLDGENSSFSFTIDASSVDTGNEKRDEHLRGPDFLDARQFRQITFKSTGVTVDTTGDKPVYRVTGDLTLHGVTKSVTLPLTLNKEGKDPWGSQRAGLSTQFTLQRSDYGMDKMLEAVGNDVTLMVSFEGTSK